MEKEFVPYTLALEMKSIGFDEPCFGFYDDISKDFYQSYTHTLSNNNIKNITKAPLYQQAFRWFREKYNAVCEIIRKEDGNHSEFIGWVYINNRKIDVVSYWDSKTYEEAELKCLRKLIEYAKLKQS